ncbi:triose-phosphate isomerase [Bogoriella caseilytica]|uniref:Triosephosphate isomerase n=1 Tax=Bogoriella caseilytica TaxID=56055 RepID=A0A3N2BFX7_9MICO|nr:triose-phosphate isomerase [Bogoriella caseilytica]ROR74163.1 triosephosphate isomerase [Bogoriella caseilytica]
MTTRWVGTSWKMHKTLAESVTYAQGLVAALRDEPGEYAGVQPFVIPSHTALASVDEALGPARDRPAGLLLGAQDAHWEDAGAWTGEVSVPQVADAGAQVIEIGHSERREHFADSIERTAWKVRAALRHGLMPLLCVGEPDAVQRAGGSREHVLDQARGALDGLSSDELDSVLIAYEPVWAIGEHGRTPHTAEIDGPLQSLQGEFGDRVQAVLYGGSVNAGNAVELLALGTVEGLFVGRAAWSLSGYLELLRLAAD